MSRVDFYRLARDPVDRILPAIAEKIASSGGKLLIVAADRLLRDAIDATLWAGRADSFLPHGRVDSADAMLEPILLGSDVIDAPANGARNILLADGEWRDAALMFERVFFFFDDSAIVQARQAWRALSANPRAEPHFWKQDSRGHWSKSLE